ncbi:hypothetical protein JCM13664_19950 [Methylothermus subterraneus]
MDEQDLRRLIPLQWLPQESFQRLRVGWTVEEAAVGAVLFQRGSEDADWIYLLEGEVGLEADGIVLERIEGGSAAARFPLAHQVPRKVTARALTKLKYLRIDPSQLTFMHADQNEVFPSAASVEAGPDWMSKLFKLPVFQRLPASNLHKLVQRLKPIEFKGGDKVIAQGELGDCVYILRAGKCQVTRRPRPNAREIQLARLEPGDLFGEDAVLSGQPRAMDVSMLTDGVVLRLDKEDFLSLVVEPVLRELDFESAAREIEQGANWLDVRDPESFRRCRLKGSLNIPFFSLRMQLSSLQRQRKYILVCERGEQSRAAAFLLLRFGFEAAVLAGGLTEVPVAYLVGEEVRLEAGPAEEEILIEAPADGQSAAQPERIQREIRDLPAELEGLRAENQALRRELDAAQAAQEEAAALRQELMKMDQAKQALEAEVAAQRLRIEELEEVIRQYCEAFQAEGGVEAIQALRTELEMVREQADQDVAAMRQEVEAARRECKRLEQLLADRQGPSDAAWPKELVAVDPDQLPLCLPKAETTTAPAQSRLASALWSLVGILLSLASLGIGLQTEAGRLWLSGFLQAEETTCAQAAYLPRRSENSQNRAPKTEELFAP